jgi:predicted nuclease with TOPRIM domain
LAQVTQLKVVNKLFPATTTADELSTHHHLFFEQRQASGPKTTLKELEEIVSQYEEKEEEERRTAFLSYLEEQMKKTLPEVEELPTHFYEDGLQALVMTLKMKQLEAMEHWKGNKNFSQFDIMKKFIQDLDLDE